MKQENLAIDKVVEELLKWTSQSVAEDIEELSPHIAYARWNIFRVAD